MVLPMCSVDAADSAAAEAAELNTLIPELLLALRPSEIPVGGGNTAASVWIPRGVWVGAGAVPGVDEPFVCLTAGVGACELAGLARDDSAPPTWRWISSVVASGSSLEFDVGN